MENKTCFINNVTTSTIETSIYTVTGGLLTFLIITTNLLILASILKFPNLRTASNIIIANLAVADLLVGVLLVPYNVATIRYPWLMESKYGCIVKMFFWVFCIGSAIIGLSIMSIDRFVALSFPLRHRVLATKLISLWVCGSMWIIWLLFSVLSLFVFNNHSCHNICMLAVVMPKAAFQLTAFFLGTILLFSGISFVSILRILAKFDNRNATRANREEKISGVIVALVFGLFLLFLIPIIATAVYASSVQQIQNRLLVEWIILLTSVNSVVNGFVYGIKRSDFRNAYLAILTCKRTNRIAPFSQATNVSLRNEYRGQRNINVPTVDTQNPVELRRLPEQRINVISVLPSEIHSPQVQPG